MWILFEPLQTLHLNDVRPLAWMEMDEIAKNKAHFSSNTDVFFIPREQGIHVMVGCVCVATVHCVLHLPEENVALPSSCLFFLPSLTLYPSEDVWSCFLVLTVLLCFAQCSERQRGPAALCSYWPCSDSASLPTFFLPYSFLFFSSHFMFVSLATFVPVLSKLRKSSLWSQSHWPLTDQDGSVWPWRVGLFLHSAWSFFLCFLSLPCSFFIFFALCLN